MTLSFCNSTLPFTFLSRPSLDHYVYRKIYCNFCWRLGIMGKGRNSIESSRAQDLSAGDGSNSAICEDSVRPERHGPQLSGDNKGNITIGSIEVSLMKWIAPAGSTNVKGSSSSQPLVARRNLSSETRNSNYALAGRKFDPLYVKPFDICLCGRQNSGLDVPLHASKESCTEMQEGATEKRILRPGMVLLKHYITHKKQVELVKVCRKLGLGPGGFYRPGYEGGAKLRLQMMCLGLDWDPQTRKYAKKRSIDGTEPPKIPRKFGFLAKMAVQEAQFLTKKKFRVSNVEDVLPSMSPDICIVNFYTASGRLGLHQDRDESRESLRKGLPVVSFSVGDSAEFLHGDQRDVDKAEKVLLESGDVLIFGGESRLVFHGVSSIIPNSAPQALLQRTGPRPGRLNLTFRQF